MGVKHKPDFIKPFKEKKSTEERLQNIEKDNLNLCEAILNMQYQQDLKELGVK